MFWTVQIHYFKSVIIHVISQSYFASFSCFTIGISSVAGADASLALFHIEEEKDFYFGCFLQNQLKLFKTINITNYNNLWNSWEMFKHKPANKLKIIWKFYNWNLRYSKSSLITIYLYIIIVRTQFVLEMFAGFYLHNIFAFTAIVTNIKS